MNEVCEWLCREIEARTSLKRIEARGTVRLALRAGGFDVKRVSSKNLAVVVRLVLSKELARRKVPDAEQLCEALAADLPRDSAETLGRDDNAAAVFGRLARIRSAKKNE